MVSFLKVIVLIYFIQCSHFVLAQNPKWNFGVSTGLTSERFAIEQNYIFQNGVINYQYEARSFPSLFVGIWAERKLSSKFSLVPQLGYHFVRIDENILTGRIPKAGSDGDQKNPNVMLLLGLV